MRVTVAVLALAGVVAALALAAATSAAAQPYEDTVTFLRVGDAEVAVEAVRNGTLDIYYQSVPSRLVADTEGISVYAVPAGGSLGLLLNPAEGERFNPFQLSSVRFAVNFMVDRDRIVDELLEGYGAVMVSPYAPHDPDYIRTLEATESFAIRYDPDVALSIIQDAMSGAGAVMLGGTWHMDGEPVGVTVFIRDDDPIRADIGETLASDLEDAGFAVQRNYGDLAQAYQEVYGSDPGMLGWHVYTEGWGGGFSTYDDSSLAAFYSPWVGNMPGYNNPEFWNYENPELDRVTQTIYNAQYEDGEHRTQLVREAATLGIQESVRLFLVSQADTYAVNEDVHGVVNHVGAGISHSMTLTNAQVPSDGIVVGVRHLSQSSWNPVAGFGDVYSLDIAGPLGIPSGVSHPHTGGSIPHAVQRQATTAGPDGTLEVPPDAVLWDPYAQGWAPVGENVTAVTAVTLDYTFSNWHHGQAADINDVLHGLYFVEEWSVDTGEGDDTVDPEHTESSAPGLEILVGVRPVGEDSMVVYLNYWTFDESDLASTGVQWLSIPWEIFYASERAVADGRVAFSQTQAQAQNVPWLSLIDPEDTAVIREYLATFLEEGTVPPFLQDADPGYHEARYEAAISWIDEYGHAYVDNGPFMLVSHDDEAGKAVLAAFQDPSYPYPQGVWSQFGVAAFPKVVGMATPTLVAGEPYSFGAFTTNADTLRYFLSYETGGLVYSGQTAASGEDAPSVPAEATEGVSDCQLALRVFALSESVVIPDVRKTTVGVSQCGISLEERLESLGITEDMEFLRTTTAVVDAATRDGGVTLEEVIRIVDEEEISGATLALLYMILEGSIDGDELFEYLAP